MSVEALLEDIEQGYKLPGIVPKRNCFGEYNFADNTLHCCGIGAALKANGLPISAVGIERRIAEQYGVSRDWVSGFINGFDEEGYRNRSCRSINEQMAEGYEVGYTTAEKWLGRVPSDSPEVSSEVEEGAT